MNNNSVETYMVVFSGYSKEGELLSRAYPIKSFSKIVNGSEQRNTYLDSNAPIFLNEQRPVGSLIKYERKEIREDVV